MYYKKIYDFIQNLNKNNIEELKPQLNKYVGELILNIKDENNTFSLDDIDDMIDIVLTREDFQYFLEEDLQEEEDGKLGLLTDEFMDIYKEFSNEIAKRGFIDDAIDLTKDVLKGLGCIHRSSFLISTSKGSVDEKMEYMISIQFLEDLQQQLYQHLNQYIKDIRRERLIILGLVNYIKSELKEDLDKIGSIILSELQDKSLEDFNKENNTNEYKSIINKNYIKELQMRQYSWNILSLRLQEVYYVSELYKDILE